MAADLEQSTGVNPLNLSPMQMAYQLMASGREVNPDIVKKFMEMEKDYADRAAEREFIADMVACQAEMSTVVKLVDNKRTGKKYAPLEEVQFKAKPVYTRHGFALSFGEGESKLEGHTRVVVDVLHKAGHVKRYDGDYPWDGKGAKGGDVMNAIQGHVSTNTYAQRDMIRKVFNITIADADKDGEEQAKIGPDRIKAINKLWDQAIESGRVKDDIDAWLRWLKVESLEELDDRHVELFERELKRQMAAKTKGAIKNGGL